MADIVQVTATVSAFKRHGVTEDSCEISATLHGHRVPRRGLGPGRRCQRCPVAKCPNSGNTQFQQRILQGYQEKTSPEGNIQEQLLGWWLLPAAECHSQGKSRCLDRLHNPHQFFSCLANQILLPPLCFLSQPSLSLSLARLL